jgi:peptidoglycan/LPS O-acetylase OafA/YrhL
MLFRIDMAVGFRGSFLLVLAAVDALTAWSLMHPPEPIAHISQYRFLQDIAPLGAWASLWVGVGLVCAVYAFRRVDWPAFLASALLNLGWIVLLLIAWGFGDVTRGWVTASQWVVAGFLVVRIAAWPEPRRDERGRVMG